MHCSSRVQGATAIWESNLMILAEICLHVSCGPAIPFPATIMRNTDPRPTRAHVQRCSWWHRLWGQEAGGNLGFQPQGNV